MLALRAARALRGARRFSDASGGLQLSFAAPHTVYYFETSVASVTLPGASGEYGVTAGHSPLAEQLRPGVVAITHKAIVRFFMGNHCRQWNLQNRILGLEKDFYFRP